MNFRFNLALVLLGALGLVASITSTYALDKDKAKFVVPALAEFDFKQTGGGVTIAVKSYEREELAKTAFGKLNPYQHGILPVLLLIQNDTKNALQLEQIRVEHVAGSEDRIEATPPEDVKFLRAPRRPSMVPSPIPGLGKGGKNPLAAWEIEGRAFTAKMVRPGDSASGFFYFQTGHRRGAKIYVSGIKDAGTGAELLFFELPI